MPPKQEGESGQRKWFTIHSEKGREGDGLERGASEPPALFHDPDLLLVAVAVRCSYQNINTA